jgi:V8-like Glu-specific endopeptidase
MHKETGAKGPAILTAPVESRRELPPLPAGRREPLVGPIPPAVPFPDNIQEEEAVPLSDMIRDKITTYSRYSWSEPRCQVKRFDRRPWSAICYLETTYPGDNVVRATGFLISASVVATAAHALAYPLMGQALSVRVIPARDGSAAPHDEQTVTDRQRWAYAPGWNPGIARNNNRFDYGVIWLPYAFPNTGYLEFAAITDDKIGEYEATNNCTWPQPCQLDQPYEGRCKWFVAGYPKEMAATMWCQSGRLLQYRNLAQTLTYSMLTSDGQSGGPVLGFFGDPAQPYVIGIHTSRNGPGIARRIDAPLYREMRGWLAEAGVA